MLEQQPPRITSIMARPDQPLIAAPVATNGHEQIIYFTDEADADQALGRQGASEPIKLAGVWSDLDADTVLDDLDRLRHGSVPSPPVTSL